MNARAVFNELVQDAKLEPGHYPSAYLISDYRGERRLNLNKVVNNLWVAFVTVEPYNWISGYARTKAQAIDLALSKLYVASGIYCCKRRCFRTPTCHVDGIACEYCMALGFCRCSCRSHTMPLRVQNPLELFNEREGTYFVMYSKSSADINIRCKDPATGQFVQRKITTTHELVYAKIQSAISELVN